MSRLAIALLLLACGPRAAPPPSEPPLTCKQMIECDGRCGEDRPCAVRCLTRGSPEGQDRYRALTTCTSTHKCVDADCITASCGAEVTACRGE